MFVPSDDSVYSLNWGFDWQGRRLRRPGLSADPGSGGEDSGSLRGGSRRRTGSEETRRDGDSETDLRGEKMK